MSESISVKEQKQTVERQLSSRSKQKYFQWPIRGLSLTAAFSLLAGILVSQEGWAGGMIYTGASLLAYSIGRTIFSLRQNSRKRKS